MSPGRFKLALVPEGEVADVEGFETEAERTAFASGFRRGADFYSGDGRAVRIPEEQAELKPDQVEQLWRYMPRPGGGSP